jgi:small GTP-binding protein
MMVTLTIDDREVQATSVKLLSDDGKTLQYAATWGLGVQQWADKQVELSRSPLNRRLLEGEPFVTGDVSQPELFQFGEGLAAAGVRSVLFAPLKVDGRVIGVLGAYCARPHRFDSDDVAFMLVAAGLVAIAIENARAYQKVQRLMEERSRFMWRVAHNLRAPLTAIISMLDVVRGGHLGSLSDQQTEFLRRVDRRVHSMAAMIGELMVLARGADPGQQVEPELVDLAFLAGRLRRTFEQEAVQRNLSLEIPTPVDLPRLRGDPALIEQLLENLVSNSPRMRCHRYGASSTGRPTPETWRRSVRVWGSRWWPRWWRATTDQSTCRVARARAQPSRWCCPAILKAAPETHCGPAMQRTPSGMRWHIGLFGRRNVGKSSLLNALTGQQVAIVSAQPGTTTDPVNKPMELHPIGPVLFIDTAGVDDTGDLGALRVQRTRAAMQRTELALLVTDAGQWGGDEERLLGELEARRIPTLVVFNKQDLGQPSAALRLRLADRVQAVVTVTSTSGEGVDRLRAALMHAAPDAVMVQPNQRAYDLYPGRSVRDPIQVHADILRLLSRLDLAPSVGLGGRRSRDVVAPMRM